MPDTIAFTKKTFTYFDGARRHADDAAWFEANKQLYVEHVELPLTHLVMEINRAISPLLPGITFSPRKLRKPLLRQAKDSAGKPIGPAIRPNTSAFFSESSESMFETNPGLYIALGAADDDNVLGGGLYEPSSRQTHLLRPAFIADYDRVHAILSARTFRKHWPGLTGDTYKRFPKDFDENAPGAEYLWFKRVLISRHLTREEVLDPAFVPNAVQSFVIAAPFITWLRTTCGLYKKPVGGYGKDREL